MMIKKKFLIIGTVQGVGFRPFIYKIAVNNLLKGSVKNTGGGVEIELDGDKNNIDIFLMDLKEKLPPAAVIENISEITPHERNHSEFIIEKSNGKAKPELNVSPDLAICDDCLRELNDPNDRRYEYPFINCVNCGPRYTIIEQLPYDRKQTTIKSFKMCNDCESEYTDVTDRRYHAQPISCWDCGPNYFLDSLSGIDAVKKAAKLIKNNKIIVVKSWGGFHIIGNAENVKVIERVRELKKREFKPIAVMAKNLDTVRKYAKWKDEYLELYNSSKKPIFLFEKKINNKITEALAPQNNTLGIMLPYSPVHHLLFKYSGLSLIIATSLNYPGSPTIKENTAAKSFFKGKILEHDLNISFRTDDSVIKPIKDDYIMIRRSRGYVPGPIYFPFNNKILSSGASENISFCYTKGNKAYPSQYFGKIEFMETQRIYEDNIRRWKKIWNYEPQILVCDHHPGYESTGIFEKLSKEWKKPLIKVQHQHAHLAGCAAENKLEGKLMGIGFDGLGYSEEGELWGGEFMIFDRKSYKRVGSLEPHALPGGDIASKEIWRMAVSYLKTANISIDKFDHLKKLNDHTAIEKMLSKNINSPLTTSAGRLFDAVAAILNITLKNTYHAQAPISLESFVDITKKGFYEYRIINNDDIYQLNTSIIIEQLAKDHLNKIDISIIATKFHYTLAKASAELLKILSKKTGIKKACLSGGVFCNTYLSNMISEFSKEYNIDVYTHHLVSPNDNGLSYGQAVIGAANLKEN
ncbi:carbamoyltransferase HypF [bacterium]|nr:carbamoyltransferase HypF [bacterium]